MYGVNKIINLFEYTKSIPLKLRWIGRQVGVKHPQIIKHHLQKLEKEGLITIDKENKIITRSVEVDNGDDLIAYLPIMSPVFK